MRTRSVWTGLFMVAFLAGTGQGRAQINRRSLDAYLELENAAAGSGIEASSNGCVVYFAADAPSIRRVDTCSKQTLSDFNTSPLPDSRGPAQLKQLSDGGMLVADHSVIVRLDAGGNLVRTFDGDGKDCWSGLTVSTNEQSFWGFNSCDQSATQFSLDSADALQSFSTTTNRAESPRGRMFGGGTEFTSTGTEVHHGMDLHCDAGVGPNYLQVLWGDYVFVLTSLTSISCANDPALHSGATFNTISGTGTGALNGAPGVMIEFTFTDDGQPSVLRDNARIVIRGALAMTALEVNGKIYAGTHIAKDQ